MTQSEPAEPSAHTPEDPETAHPETAHQPVPESEPAPARRMQETLEVRVRRSPKYAPFILVGILAGFIVAGVLSLLPVDTSQLSGDFSRGQAAGILMAVLGIVGGFAGAIIVLILDRRSVKSADTSHVTADYESEDIPPTREELVAQAKAQLAEEKAQKAARRRGQAPASTTAESSTQEGTR